MVVEENCYMESWHGKIIQYVKQSKVMQSSILFYDILGEIFTND